MEDVLAILLIFGTGGAFLLSISPIGRAIAARIKSGATADAEELRELHETVQDLLEENRAIREELTEVQERVDFTERMLSSGREKGPPQNPPE